MQVKLQVASSDSQVVSSGVLQRCPKDSKACKELGEMLGMYRNVRNGLTTIKNIKGL